jgi:hypothetical protein
VLQVRGIRNPDAPTRRARNDGGLWERRALTDRQVAELNAQRAEQGRPDLIIRKPDWRYRPARYFDAVPEALGQAFIVNALKARLDELMPEPLADIKTRQNGQKAEMRKLLAAARKRQRNRNGQ